jgi:hypothetical protein
VLVIVTYLVAYDRCLLKSIRGVALAGFRVQPAGGQETVEKRDPLATAPAWMKRRTQSPLDYPVRRLTFGHMNERCIAKLDLPFIQLTDCSDSESGG